jgi:hypothetical protein
MARRSALVSIFTLALLLLAGSSVAQRLAAVLPEDTVFAVGTEGLADHAGKLDAFTAEAERLGLAEAFTELFGAGDLEEEFGDEIPEGLRELEPLDLFGREAWLSVSISSFNPMPAVTLTGRLTGEARTTLGDALRQAAEEQGAQTVSEGANTIYLFPVEEPDSPVQVLAVSQAGDVLTLSSNPDVLRGVLRRLAGSGEPGFTSSAGYAATLAGLGSGNVYTFLDFGRLSEALEPLGATSGGFEVLVSRVLGGVGTVGTGGSVMRVDDEGLSSEAIRVPGSGDPTLAALLASTRPASRDPLRFVPAGALGVSVSNLDIPGWWAYLNDLARSSGMLEGSLDDMVLEFTGIDLTTSLFGWMGPQAASITTGLGAPVQPGVPSQNLLGEVVYLVQADDVSAANQGLSTLLATVSAMVAGFADPTGMGGAAGIEQREVAGVQVTSYRMGPGVTVAQAAVDGWALLATSDDAIDKALAARAAGAALTGELGRLARQVPGEATAYSLSDVGETLAQSGAQMVTQMQMFAGLGGELDFDALESAGETLEAFFAFIADRTGGGVSYTVTDSSGVSRSFGSTKVDW